VTRIVPDWLATSAAGSPDGTAVQGDTFSWTFAELDRAAGRLAAALAETGVRDGMRVAALLADDAPAVALMHAVRRVRAVLVPLNRREVKGELATQLGRVEAAVLVHDGTHVARARELTADGSVAGLAIDAVLAGAGRPPRRDEPPLVDLDAPAVVLFTSGTTARPRAALLTQGNLAASADAWATVLRPRPTDRWLACLPLFHVAGLAVVVRAARWGIPVEVLPRFTPDRVAERIEAGVSHASVVASQLEPLVDAVGHRPPRTLRAVLVGGGPVPGPLVAHARSAGFPALTTYGMTETASGIAVGGADPVTLADATALRPLASVDVRIGDADARGEGAVLVRGPMVLEGYLDDPAATAERLRDGWLDTGDVGRIDEHGCVQVLDRRDDLIISGGENVSPAEIESVLLAHPDVREAAVVGRPDPVWGSVPVAAVVLTAGSRVSDAGLERHCRERLAGYKVPVHFDRLDELPRNAAGKVVRRDLPRALGLIDR
jgi:O-succinylbenzoic acid--CoA ligase